MITPLPPWQAIWQRNFTRIDALLDFCQIAPSDRRTILHRPSFPLSVPERIAKKMEKGNINDPLFRQFVPIAAEGMSADGFYQDPLGESSAQRSKKILHKYRRRALIITTSACGMHCRFSFRRHFPFCQPSSDFCEELAWLKEHPEIDEVILSGGDPLAQPTTQLFHLMAALASLSSIKRLRIHTRFPIGIPERIDDELLTCLQKSRQQVYIVIHVNHPREVDDDVVAALRQIMRLQIPILSQTVLLRGVNDSVDVLEQLMTTLGNAGILPYYLHQLDRVHGAAHFEVPVGHGLSLIEELRTRISGYLVPQYVREEAGKPCKMAIATGYPTLLDDNH